MACLRDQADFIESYYSDTILKTGYAGSVDDLMRQRSHLFDYLKQLELWESLFDLQVIGYQDLVQDQDLPRSFIGRTTGIPQESLPSDRGRRWNTTHPVECLVMKRYLNGVPGTDRENILKIYHRYKRFYLRRFESSIRRNLELSEAFLGSRKHWLSALQVKAIRDRYHQENLHIAGKYQCLLSGMPGATKTKRSRLKPWQECFLVGWMLTNYPPDRSWFVAN
ncbi:MULTISPECIES: hypothetical protein [Aphanothece]|uniref:hypothetical protein n=1 Tax=Aphanothece TaxID=1121 RepID=UPI003984B619